MSLAFTITLRPSRLARSLGWATTAIGGAGLTLTLIYLVMRGQSVVAAALATAVVLAVGVAWRRRIARSGQTAMLVRSLLPGRSSTDTKGGAASVLGTLIVDERGAASWVECEGARPLPAEPASWYAGAWLMSLRIRPLGAPAHDLLIGRDSVDPGQWRQLRSWLLWRHRGGSPHQPL